MLNFIHFKHLPRRRQGTKAAGHFGRLRPSAQAIQAARAPGDIEDIDGALKWSKPMESPRIIYI